MDAEVKFKLGHYPECEATMTNNPDPRTKLAAVEEQFANSCACSFTNELCTDLATECAYHKAMRFQLLKLFKLLLSNEKHYERSATPSASGRMSCKKL